MPAVVTGRPHISEAIWVALRIHIIRRRQKKKQEQEANEEYERLRKERERQQKQDVMTLGETKEQISQLEARLAELKDEKHQLFLQLKKVLNEDDRRRQLNKESNMFSDPVGMPGYPTMSLSGPPQIFLQQNIPLAGRAPIYKVAPSHGTQHTLLPTGSLKRSRSPSPPPSHNYHQGYGYKPSTMPAYPQQKVDDNRRHEYVRAVLWNKNTQYAGSQPFFAPHASQQVATVSSVPYTHAPAQTVYASQYSQPSVATSAQPREEAPKPSQHSVYLSQPRTTLTALPHNQDANYGGYVTSLHPPLEIPGQKSGFAPPKEAAEKYYNVTPIRPATHVPIHGGSIPIQQPPQGAKTGGITTGYPIRAQPVTAPPHPPSHVTTGSYQSTAASTSHNVYVSQAPNGRVLYSQAGHHGHPPSTHQPPSQSRYTVPSMQREV